MALSTTSNTMWCRPVPSEVSPMYMPGRLRTASKPFSTLILSESYSLSSFSCWFLSVIGSLSVSRETHLNPHWHNYVFELAVPGYGNEHTAVCITKRTVHLLAV